MATILYRLRRRLLRPRLVPLQRAYPDSEKTFRWPQVRIETPEACDIPVSDVVGELRDTSVTTAPAFSSVVDDALYCTTNEVLLKSKWEVIAESYEPWQYSSPCSNFRSPFDATLCHNTPEPDPIAGHSTSFRSIRQTYYHTLVDNIPRIAHLHHPRYASMEIEVLVTQQLTDREQYFAARLLPSNCRIRHLNPNRVYRVQRFILLSHMAYHYAGILHPEYLEWFRERVLPARPSRRDRLIFVSREQAQRGRRITNLDEVYSVLGRFDFEIHKVEDYPIDKQIELFHDARVVVGSHGAGLTNMLFSQRGIDVLELFPSSSITPHYYYLCKSLGNRYRYQLGTHASLNDDFEVDTVQFDRNLRAMLDRS